MLDSVDKAVFRTDAIPGWLLLAISSLMEKRGNMQIKANKIIFTA